MESDPAVACPSLACPHLSPAVVEPELPHEETSKPNKNQNDETVKDKKEGNQNAETVKDNKKGNQDGETGVKEDGKISGENGGDQSEDTPKDEIELGYSPGSPVPSSAATVPSAKSTHNKFDKIYYQNLGLYYVFLHATQDVDGSLLDMDVPGNDIPESSSGASAEQSVKQAAALAVAGKSK
eukprot:s771_g15.t1